MENDKLADIAFVQLLCVREGDTLLVHLSFKANSMISRRYEGMLKCGRSLCMAAVECPIRTTYMKVRGTGHGGVTTFAPITSWLPFHAENNVNLFSTVFDI